MEIKTQKRMICNNLGDTRLILANYLKLPSNPIEPRGVLLLVKKPPHHTGHHDI
jgi:hypothetical protein